MKNPLLCCSSSFSRCKNQRRPLRMRNHLSSDSIAVVRRWSNATGGSFSLFPRSSSSSTPSVPQGNISTPPTLPNIIHTTKTGPLFEDGKGFWGGWGGWGGYQSIADNHSVWPQPCNAWPTSKVYIFSVFFCLLLWLIVLVLQPTFLQDLPHCHTLVHCM